MAGRTRTYRRRTKSGGMSKPFSRKVTRRRRAYGKSTLTGARRRKQRQRRLRKRGGKLAPGLKFNARGQIVGDRNRTRVANRRTKLRNRRRRRAGKRPSPSLTGSVRRRKRRR